jgi:dienelactone hydrolase
MVKIEEWSDQEIREACSFTSLIDRIYADMLPSYGIAEKCQSKEEFITWQQNFREKVIKWLGIQDILRSHPEISIVKGKPKEFSEEKTYRVEHFYLKSWHETLIPVLLCIPKNIPLGTKIPGFVCTHGHGQNKQQLVGRESNKQYPNSTWARDLAQMGCITITMDQWGWAERGGYRIFKQKANYDDNEAKYALNMLLFGRTINGLRFFDAIRQIDYLLSREDIDPNRIGIGGLSLGGTTAGFTAAIEPRIKLALVAGYMNTFKSSILDIGHCSCNYIPGISGPEGGEMYDIFSLIAPRPVCFITGKSDSIYPIDAAKSAFTKIQAAYHWFNAENLCILDETPYGHRWRGDIAYPFVQKIFFSK